MAQAADKQANYNTNGLKLKEVITRVLAEEHLPWDEEIADQLGRRDKVLNYPSCNFYEAFVVGDP